MDCYLVDILYLSEAFGGTRIGNCDIKPTDGATIFAYLRDICNCLTYATKTPQKSSKCCESGGIYLHQIRK